MGVRPWKEREREGDMSMVVSSTVDFMNTDASFARLLTTSSYLISVA